MQRAEAVFGVVSIALALVAAELVLGLSDKERGAGAVLAESSRNHIGP